MKSLTEGHGVKKAGEFTVQEPHIAGPVISAHGALDPLLVPGWPAERERRSSALFADMLNLVGYRGQRSF